LKVEKQDHPSAEAGFVNTKVRLRLGIPFFLVTSLAIGQSSSLNVRGLYSTGSSANGQSRRHEEHPAPASSIVELSPGKWNPADRERVEKLEMSLTAPSAREIDGRSGLVSNTGSPISVHAGIEALKQGGSAADAAATVALTQIAVEMGSVISYAGILDMAYYDARTGKVYCLNAGWNSYRGETGARSIPAQDLRSIGINRQTTTGSEGRMTMVGGFMAGIEAMNKRFGRLPFSQLFQPAIWYADNGVAVTPLMSGLFGAYGKPLSRTAEGRGFLHQAGSDQPKIRDRFIQAELARTLRGVATQGSSYMYSGPWAEQFVAAVQRDGGKVTMEDLRDYQPTWEEPLSTTFGGATVFVPGKSNEGSHQVLEALNLIAELHLDQKAPYWKDPAAFAELSRILQFAETSLYATPEVQEYQRKNALAFSSDDRITRAYARAMAPMISELQTQGPPSGLPHHSAGCVVIDRWGNIAALVHTIESMPFGGTGIVVAGIPLSGVAGIQQGQLAAVRPGSRIPGLAAPVIVIAGKKPRLMLATVGTSLVPETVRILLGVLGNHLEPAEVLSAPALLYNPVFNAGPGQSPEPFSSHLQFVPEGAYDTGFLKSLEAFGLKLEQKPKIRARAIRGTSAVVSIDRRGILHSYEHPALIDFADAY
jgi:gamma-glutamyltranspeptidase/glutathione hydrolase